MPLGEWPAGQRPYLWLDATYVKVRQAGRNTTAIRTRTHCPGDARGSDGKAAPVRRPARGGMPIIAEPGLR